MVKKTEKPTNTVALTTTSTGGKSNVDLVPPAPWEKQDGESARAFSAFVVYRDLPAASRKLESVSEQLYPQAPWAVSKVREWASKYNWQVRADAWSAQLDAERRKVQLETVKTMTIRHIEAAIAMQGKGLEALRNLQAKEDLSAADIRLLITEGAKLERLSRGLVTDRTGGKKDDGDGKPGDEPADLSGISDDELRRLEGVAKQAAEGAKPPASS